MGERRRGISGAGGPGGAFGGWRNRNGGEAPKRMQTVWILADPTTKKLKPVQIRTGITDGHYTEVISGDLKEGDMVIVGLATSKVEGNAPPGAGPMGGGRGPGGGGRGR
jgi:HlyD family secretion protein